MTLKFKSDSDKKIFLAECNRLDLLEKDDIPKEIFELFLKKRRRLIKNVIDFRKSQDAKARWRTNRFNIMKGIKSWHKSTEGKRFHRQLGRFLATRLIESQENNNDDNLTDKFSILKGLSSLQTHLYIEGEFFRYSLEDDVDYYLFLEYAIPLILSLTEKIFNGNFSEITEDELEVVFRLIDENCVLSELSNLTSVKYETIKEEYNKLDVDLSLTHGLLEKFNKVCIMNKNNIYEETKNE